MSRESDIEALRKVLMGGSGYISIAEHIADSGFLDRIRREEYVRGYEKGRNYGYECGFSDGYNDALG